MSAVIYDYRVRDKSGKEVAGQLEGSSSAAVSKTLRERGLVPLEVKERKTSALKKEIKIPGLSGRIKAKEIAILSRQFATMVNSGLSLVRTLNILESQTENPALAKVVGEVRAEVEKGSSLSVAMEAHPKVFSQLFVAMIKAGEIGGVLDETLVRLADMMEAAHALRSKVKSAMAYPVVVLGLVGFIVFAMLTFVVPMFEEMYAELGGDLPAPTKILVAAGNILKQWWFIVLGLQIGAIFGIRRYIKTPDGRARWDALKLKVPIFGRLVHKTSLSRFSRSLSVLSRSGVPILQAIDIVVETSGNYVMGKALGDVRESVKRGESLAAPLANHPVFPPMVAQMMSVGEETGALDEMLAKVADFYDREVDDTVAALTSLIEPLLIIVLGVTVGGILIALYLPMFNIASLLDGSGGG
jgi:type IV pilus assembly protein PilC